uniref:Uncharacterized protein n=1 Tax=Gasterosteus aculeatus aculeatus TaxID=481459 RepID=A0AAQ4QXE7_GASAC
SDSGTNVQTAKSNRNGIIKAHCFVVVYSTNKTHPQKLECIPHRSESEKNDSPQRSCTSLALGLPTSRGGWHGPGGTAGKTTHQLKPGANNNFPNSRVSL